MGALVVLCLLSLFSAAWGVEYSSTNPLQVQMWLDSTVRDLGWGFEHNTGRLAVEWELDEVVTELKEGVETFTNPSLIGDSAANGTFGMIIITTQTDLVDVALAHPSVYFLSVAFSGAKSTRAPNLSYVFGKIEQVRYATGVLVGLMMSERPPSGESIGYIASSPLAEVYRGVNAFFSGMRSVWPEATLKVVWMNTFSDPDLSTYSAEVLIDQHGAAVITHHTDDLDALTAASRRGAWSIGYQSDQGSYISKKVLTSCVWNWSSTYLNFTEQVLGSNWVQQDALLPISSGVATLGTWSPLVPQAIRSQVEGVLQSIIDGSFDIFCGSDADPWRTNTTGECLGTQELYNMYSLYPEIDDLGSIAIPLTLVVVSSGLRAAMQALAGVGIASAVVFAVLVLCYRRSNVIRYSSPFFCCTMLFGACLNYASVFLLSVDPAKTGACNAVWWLLCVGFGTFYAALLVKTWRIAEIFRNLEHLRTKQISMQSLLLILTIVVGLELVLLVLLTAIDMPVAEAIRQDTDSSLSTYEYRVVCRQTQASQALLWILVAYNGSLLAAGVLLSFQTRSLSKTFNESKHIAAGIYAFSAMLAICVPLVAISSDYVARYWITALGIILSTTTAVFVLFLPKFYIVFSGQDEAFNPFTKSATNPSTASPTVTTFEAY